MIAALWDNLPAVLGLAFVAQVVWIFAIVVRDRRRAAWPPDELERRQSRGGR